MLIRDGEKGGGRGVWRWGKREIRSLHCHHQSDSCIKMVSDESHFNASLIVRDKVSESQLETVSQSTNHNFFQEPERRAEAEPSRGPSAAYQPNALQLGQTPPVF